MTNFTELTKLMMERKELNGRYGFAEASKFPEQHSRIEDIDNEIFQELPKVDTSHTVQRHLYDSLDSIAGDFLDESYNPDAIENIVHYTQDEFIESFITEGLEGEAELKVIDSLMNWMDSDALARWIDSNYLTNMPNTYTNRWVSYILMVHE